MNLFAWIQALLRRWFGPRPVEREVPLLGAGAGSRTPDGIRERISTEGPWRKGHLRLALRDARLLPDPSRAGRWQIGKGWIPRKRVMSKQEASRLFGGTLRTRDRDGRTLTTDEAQLTRLGLPLWRSEEELAAALGLSVKQLRHLSIHRAREQVSHWVQFSIPKRTGGERLIHAPKKRLKRVLRTLHAQLTSKLRVHDAAHGFIPKRSVATNARPHAKQAVVVKLDLAEFFPSVTYGRVRGLLLASGYGYPVAATLAALVTTSERQPVEIEGKRWLVPVGPRVCAQGAPTSPALCNALVRRMDARLSGLARVHGFAFTRYADDLTFSGPDASKVDRLIERATRIVATEGFRIRGKKTRVMRQGSAQRSCGVTVNDVVGLSRKERRKVRAALHHESLGKLSEAESVRLTGQLAWVHMLNPEQAKALEAKRKR